MLEPSVVEERARVKAGPKAPRGRRVASDEALREALERVRTECAVEARVAKNPVGVVRRYSRPNDREVVALVASSLAFGNVTTIRAKLDEALDRIGPRPSEAHRFPRALEKRFEGFIHRVYRGEDLAKLVLGATRVQREHGSLGAFFEKRFRESADLRESLAALTDAIREAGGFASTGKPWKKGERRGPQRLLPIRGGAVVRSACSYS